jgi:hypothetical protein
MRRYLLTRDHHEMIRMDIFHRKVWEVRAGGGGVWRGEGVVRRYGA